MNFTILNMIMLLWCMFTYIYFRVGVLAYCRVFRGMSKTFIRKNKKGASNFWLYTQLHKQKNLGILYYFNYIYLVLLGAFAIGIVFSFISVFKILIVVMGLILGAASIPVYCIALMYHNFEMFGRKFVVFRIYRDNDGKIRFFVSVIDWLFGLIPLGSYILMITKNIY